MEAVTGTLGLNLAGLIWHTINFLVLLFLLYRFLWNPVRGMLDARAQRVRESMEQAEQARRAAEQAEADRQALLAETRREAEQIRHRAEEQSKRIVDEAGARADERARQILDQAEASIQQQRQQMMNDVRGQLAELLVVAVDRVTRQAIDQSTQRSLVQQFLTSEPGLADGSVSGRPS
jgi:F-type H+-transporting ATPase subunit b